MSENRISFSFQNQQDDDVAVVIEPWALEEIVPAGAVMVFEVNTTPAPEIEFSITEDGTPYIYVTSEYVAIHVGEELRHNFNPVSRPPALSTFRVMNKILWGKTDRKT